jgi:hypothetical protein
MRLGAFLLLWFGLGLPAAAQTVVTSPRPDRVAVTIYRDPQRDPAAAPNLDWLNGYALISETRQVTLPVGDSEIRFEGVAGGIVPQSAIVSGLPERIVERNRDAYLLSPATLLDRSLGRRVSIRRTALATGVTRDQEAVIRSGADGAVILQTAEGFEALRCTGLPETLVYAAVPSGLSARPTLSIRARASQPVTASVTLSYLASGFDWQANYIVTLSPDGGRAGLFAWLTLASNDETSFANADAQAVAGRLNREAVERQPREGGPLQLRCWPQARTSDIPLTEMARLVPPPAPMIGDGEAIVVTGALARNPNLVSSSPISVVVAEQENLGDLKLYRLPEPVTVAANSQKQVALLERPSVAVRMVYRLTFSAADEQSLGPAGRVLVTRNRSAEGLGLPLPAGAVAVFAAGADRPLLLGEGFVADRAVGEDVEIPLGEAAGVYREVTLVRRRGGRSDYMLTVTNDRPQPISFEAEFIGADSNFRAERRLGRRRGMRLWAVTVPANGSATLRYTLSASD